MVFWKAWFDVRKRFFLILVLWVLVIGETRIQVASGTSRAQAAVLSGGAGASEDLQVQSQGYDRLVVDWTTGQANGTFSFMVIILAVGGVLGGASGRPDLMTLGLPSSRKAWLWAQAGMAVLLTFLLGFLEAVQVVAIAWGFGLEVPVGSVLLAGIATPLSAVIWVWPTVLAMVLLRDSVRAATAAIFVFVATASFGILGEVNRPYFRDIADLSLWDGSQPWLPLLAGAALTGITAWLALSRFQEMEV